MNKELWMCIANCPELDIDNKKHCVVTNLDDRYELYPDGCPCGNNSKWEFIKPNCKKCINSKDCVEDINWDNSCEFYFEKNNNLGDTCEMD